MIQARTYSLAVKAVMVDSSARCLLLRRSPANRSYVGCWEWPGGKVDPGEDFASAVVRETREETGLEIELTGLVGATSFTIPEFEVVLLCMEANTTGGSIRLSHEHDKHAWVPLVEFAEWKLSDAVRAFMLDYARRTLAAAKGDHHAS